MGPVRRDHGLHGRPDPPVQAIRPLSGRVPIATATVPRAIGAAGIRMRPVPPGVRRRRFLLTLANHAVLIAVSVFFLAPPVFVLLAALMSDRQSLRQSFWP